MPRQLSTSIVVGVVGLLHQRMWRALSRQLSIVLRCMLFLMPVKIAVVGYSWSHMMPRVLHVGEVTSDW